MAGLAPDPCPIWADAMDSRLIESERSRPWASSREWRSASRTTISSSEARGMSSGSTDPKMKDSDPLPAMLEKAGRSRRGAWMAEGEWRGGE